MTDHSCSESCPQAPSTLILPSLRYGLTATDPDIRAWAARILGKQRDPLAMPMLAEVVQQDEDRDVRREAFLALAAFGDPQHLPALFSLLNAPWWRYPPAALYEVIFPLREAAIAHLLTALTDPTFRAEYTRHLSWHCFYLTRTDLRQLTENPLPEALLCAILSLCGDLDPALRREAIQTLHRQEDPRATDTAFTALRDDDADVRRTAAHVLSACLPDMTRLHPYLSDPHPAVRAAALWAVPWRVQTTPAFLAELLLPASADDAAMVRVVALRRFRDQWYVNKGPTEEELTPWRARVPALLRDPDGVVRAHALFAAALVDLPELPNAVTAAIDDADPTVRAAARMLLAGYIDDTDANYIMGYTANAMVERHALMLLARLPRALAREAYAQAIADPDPAVAEVAREYYWYILTDEEERTAYALATIQDVYASLRIKALGYLAAQHHPQRLPVLLAALADSDTSVRLTAVRELACLGAREALPALRPLLHDPAEGVRRAVLNALCEMGTLADVPAVLPFLYNNYYLTRMKARAVLHKLTGVDCGTEIDAWLAWWAEHHP